MPEKPHQILMRYAPRRPPPPQARTLIPATLRAAARVAVPERAWPGSVPWRRGSAGGARPTPRGTPGNQLAQQRHPKQRHPEQALTRGSPRRRPPNPSQTVIRGRPERRPPRQLPRLARNLLPGDQEPWRQAWNRR